MSVESLVASEADSLAEEKPKQRLPEHNDFDRGHINYSTFTRQRPTNLLRNKARGHRQSLLSPQSVDNLDAEDADTPDFAMTQSMYEPSGKKEQLEKLNQQCKLMNLLASEKAAQAAKKRKMKEMKLKVSEQKRRNEERQKLVEERRIKMLADEEEKRKRIINKLGKPNNMTGSVMAQSISFKNKIGFNSKFLANRPLSSTGKVFGFGSSAPRNTCNPIKQDKVINNNANFFIMNKSVMPMSRMCASQIMHQTSQNETKMNSEKSAAIKTSKSTFNVSEINKLQIKNERVSLSNCNNFHKVQKTTPRSIKHIQATNKVEVNHKKMNEDNLRICTPIKEMSVSIKSPKPTELSEKSMISSSKQKLTKVNVNSEKEKRSILRIDNNKINAKNEKISLISSKNEVSQNCRSLNFEVDQKCDQDTEQKPEVRFITGSENSSKNDKENSEEIYEKRTIGIKEISDDEYKQRMALQRKLAREKKLREEIEKNVEKEKQASKRLLEVASPVDTSTTTESEISNNIFPNDELQIEKPIIQPEISTESINIVDHSLTTIKITVPIPNIEISKEKEELTASTDELDRLARKKRLESIMSRVKKLPSGSSENVSQQMTTSALQNMMEKGHLTGMSKTAAVLMRNANRSSDFGSSTLDVQGSTETIRTSISMDNLENEDNNDEPISRGDCDGKEDSPKEINPNIETKSNIMQNLSSTTEGSYLSSWKDKYSISDSLDSETDNTERI